MPSSRSRILAFDFEDGDLIADKYRILSQLGKGREGEVYLIKELGTGIERTAKIFFRIRIFKTDP